MTLKYDENTKLIGGFSISKVYLGRTRFSYCLHHDYDDSLGWVSEAAITDLLEKPKVKLPKYVAEYLEKCKEEGLKLGLAVGFEDCPVDIFPYLLTNMETFARAWLDGYEVEKEKKYKVYLKHTNQELLYYEDTDDFYFDHINKKNITKSFTKKELIDAGFGDVFDNPMFEVEEVE